MIGRERQEHRIVQKMDALDPIILRSAFEPGLQHQRDVNVARPQLVEPGRGLRHRKDQLNAGVPVVEGRRARGDQG
jgi:hypothetical protein